MSKWEGPKNLFNLFSVPFFVSEKHHARKRGGDQDGCNLQCGLREDWVGGEWEEEGK